MREPAFLLGIAGLAILFALLSPAKSEGLDEGVTEVAASCTGIPEQDPWVVRRVAHQD